MKKVLLATKYKNENENCCDNKNLKEFLLWLNKIHENVIRITATIATTTIIITSMGYDNKRANKCVQFTVKYTYAGITSWCATTLPLSLSRSFSNITIQQRNPL